MVSIPAMMIRALQSDLNPSIARVIRLMARCSCSTMLFKYLFCRIKISIQESADSRRTISRKSTSLAAGSGAV